MSSWSISGPDETGTGTAKETATGTEKKTATGTEKATATGTEKAKATETEAKAGRDRDKEQVKTAPAKLRGAGHAEHISLYHAEV